MNLRSSFPKSRDSRSKKTVKMVVMENTSSYCGSWTSASGMFPETLKPSRFREVRHETARPT